MNGNLLARYPLCGQKRENSLPPTNPAVTSRILSLIGYRPGPWSKVSLGHRVGTTFAGNSRLSWRNLSGFLLKIFTGVGGHSLKSFGNGEADGMFFCSEHGDPKQTRIGIFRSPKSLAAHFSVSPHSLSDSLADWQ